jgi:ribosomal protein L40E
MPTMTAAPLYRLRLGERISAGQTTPMMVFPIGAWHSAKYPDLTLDEDLAHELIANFESGVLGREPVVDSSGEHDLSAPAAGWVKRVYLASYEEGELSGLALWADVEWTGLGAQLLNDDQYKYGSVEIGSVVMNEGGEVDNVLRSMTITNVPVLSIMPGIRDAAAAQREALTLSLSEVLLAQLPPAEVKLSITDADKAALSKEIKGKSTGDLTAYNRRLFQHAGAGNTLKGFSKSDMAWFAAAIAAELKSRNPDSTAGSKPLKYADGETKNASIDLCSFDSVDAIAARSSELAEAKTCIACGAKNELDATECAKCGEKLGKALAEDITPDREADDGDGAKAGQNLPDLTAMLADLKALHEKLGTAIKGTRGAPAMREQMAAVHGALCQLCNGPETTTSESSAADSQPVSPNGKGDEGAQTQADVDLTEGGDNVKTIAIELNLDEGASEGVVLAEVKSLKTKLSEAQNQLTQIADENASRKVAVQLDELLKGGRLIAKERDEWAEVAKTNPDKYAGMVEARQAVKPFVTLGEQGTGGDNSQAADDADTTANPAAQIAKLRDAYLAEHTIEGSPLAKLEAADAAVRQAHPELYDAYRKTREPANKPAPLTTTE